jgi:hypothetical protein
MNFVAFGEIFLKTAKMAMEIDAVIIGVAK